MSACAPPPTIRTYSDRGNILRWEKNSFFKTWADSFIHQLLKCTLLSNSFSFVETSVSWLNSKFHVSKNVRSVTLGGPEIDFINLISSDFLRAPSFVKAWSLTNPRVSNPGFLEGTFHPNLDISIKNTWILLESSKFLEKNESLVGLGTQAQVLRSIVESFIMSKTWQGMQCNFMVLTLLNN